MTDDISANRMTDIIGRRIRDNLRDNGGGMPRGAALKDDSLYATYGPKNDDVPRAGELSSQVFNDLTTRIISELKETVESQITDAVNRRAHAIAQMEQLKAEIDKVFGEYEANAKRHQEKVNSLAEAVRKKVKNDTEEMIALSNRLREFADTVNVANEKFFSEHRASDPLLAIAKAIEGEPNENVT